MSIMEPQTAAEAVANGAQLLDEKLPGWWRQIDLDTLKLSKCDRCVCGQLGTKMLNIVSFAPYRIYEGALEYIGLEWMDTDIDYGFNIPSETEAEDSDDRYRELEVEWKKVIVSRLEADVLTATKKKEMVLV